LILPWDFSMTRRHPQHRNVSVAAIIFAVGFFGAPPSSLATCRFENRPIITVG